MDLTMRFFGPTPWGPEDMNSFIPIPVGQSCVHCGEPITLDDSGVRLPFFSLDQRAPKFVFEHRECFLRRVYGSVAHQQGKCPCHGGSEEDDPNLSRRQAARAAVAFYEGGRSKFN